MSWHKKQQQFAVYFVSSSKSSRKRKKEENKPERQVVQTIHQQQHISKKQASTWRYGHHRYFSHRCSIVTTYKLFMLFFVGSHAEYWSCIGNAESIKLVWHYFFLFF